MNLRINSIAIAVAFAACGIGSSVMPLAHGQERLEWLYQKQPFDYWRQRLNAEQPSDRNQAIAAVGSFRSERPQQVRSLLIGMLEDPIPAVRRVAVWQLSSLQDQLGLGGLEVIIGTLTERLIDSEEDREVRRAAASALGKLRIAGAEALAGAIARIEETNVRTAVQEELGRISHDLHDDIVEMAAVREAMEQLAQEQRRLNLAPGDRATLLRLAIERVDEPQVRAHASTLLDAADSIGDIAAQRLAAEINADDAPAIVRMSAMRHLLNVSDQKAALGAVDALADALASEEEQLRFWAATALAAIDPDSEAGGHAVTVLVDDLVRQVQMKNGVPEELSWRFLFATAHTERRDDIFRQVVERIQDDQIVAKVQATRFSILEDFDVLTPELLVRFLQYQEPYHRQRVADELAQLGPPVAKQAAPALANVLQELPEDDVQAMGVARAVVGALAKIDPDAEHTPRLDAKTLVRLVYLAVAGPWVVERIRDQGDAVIDELAKYVERMPRTPQLTGIEQYFAGNSPSMRFTTVLAQLGEPAVPALKRLVLHCQDDYRGRDAADALRQIKPAGVQALVELAQHEEAAVREPAVGALRLAVPLEAVPDTGVVEALIAAAKDENPEIRSRAISGLGRLDGAQVSDDQIQRLLPVLTESLHSGNDSVASRAIYALRSLGKLNPELVIDEFCKVLERGDPRLRFSVLSALQSFGDKSAAALPELRQIVERNGRHRSAALETIAKMGPAARQAEPLLREALDSPDYWDQLWAAIALSQFEDGEEAAVATLVHVLKVGRRTNMYAGRDPRVLAAEALGRLGPAAEPAIDPLLEVARLRPDAESRDSDDDYKVMQAAVAALGQIGLQSERVVPVLGDLLELERKKDGWGGEEVAHQAVIVLRSFAPRAELPAEGLVRRFKSPNKQPVVREMLLSMGETSVPALVNALDERELALPALELLEEMGMTAAAAVPALINVVRDRAASGTVRTAAIEALGAIGEPASPVIPYLEALSQTKDHADLMNQKQAEAARQALLRLRS